LIVFHGSSIRSTLGFFGKARRYPLNVLLSIATSAVLVIRMAETPGAFLAFEKLSRRQSIPLSGSSVIGG
jgi:hypothetical protein